MFFYLDRMLQKFRLSVVLLFFITPALGTLFSCKGGHQAIKKAVDDSQLLQSQGRFDPAAHRKQFAYGPLTTFRVSDTLRLGRPMSEALFVNVFQQLTTPASGPGECGCGRTKQLFFSKSWLLSRQERAAYITGHKDSVDLVTVYSIEKDTTRIYWMPYASADINDTTVYARWEKGQLTLRNIPFVPAEKWKNDTSSFESHSDYLGNKTFRYMSVERSSCCSRIDTMLIKWDYIEEPEAMDGVIWENGKRISDWLDPASLPYRKPQH